VQTFVMERPVSQHHSVRQSYDAVAEEYAIGFRDELTSKPLDRALLACLVEQADDGVPIADLGCGPGHVAAWLAARGVAAVGIDLSPGMIAVGRRQYPQVEFRVGDFLELPAADGEFAAAVAFYSIIHLEPGELPRAFDEIRRVLRPRALCLVAFHVGSEVRHLDDWWGHKVDIDFRFFELSAVAAAMEGAGLRSEMRLERVSYPGEVETRRGYLQARRQP
jgi:ubiquinone/menaquinone biosynthesis C-methylase UbiE